ncbi:MAG: pantetheine-phosphate adenylyltransferase, partial [Saprospiraceae bacterium]|nr:pantetheine-phosphate adenylyltransferase [Saprospiraceae bacterium]
LFDKIYVAVGVNSNKKTLFTLKTRLKWLDDVFKDEGKIEIAYFEGLTVKFCKSVDANYLIRGLRNSSDFDYEKTISQLNSVIGNGVETFFLISKPGFSHISSTIVREIIKAGGDASTFVPKEVTLNEEI